MTKFSVLLSSTASKQFDYLEKQIREKIRSDLHLLEDDPFKPRPKADIKKLQKISKRQFYRLRSGNYRAVYYIEGNLVKVTKIFPRGQGYEWLE